VRHGAVRRQAQRGRGHSPRQSRPLHALRQLARRAYFKGTSEQEIGRLVAVFAPRLCSQTLASRPFFFSQALDPLTRFAPTAF